MEFETSTSPSRISQVLSTSIINIVKAHYSDPSKTVDDRLVLTSPRIGDIADRSQPSESLEDKNGAVVMS